MKDNPAFERLALAVLHRAPRISLSLAENLGRIEYRLGRRETLALLDTPESWQRLLGQTPRRRVERLRQEMAGRDRRRRLLDEALRWGKYDSLLPLIQWRNEHRLLEPVRAGIPVIATIFHIGPFASINIGLLALGLQVTCMATSPQYVDYGGQLEVLTVSDEGGGTAAFMKCRARLKEGRVVTLAGDAYTLTPDGVRARVMGVAVKLRRGFAAIARMSRARVIPVSIAWSDRGDLIFTAWPELQSSGAPEGDREGYEARMVQEFSVLLDAQMRSRVADIDPAIFRYLSDLKRRRAERHQAAARGDGRTESAPGHS